MGRLLRNVLLDFAQFEREMTADRTRDKMCQRAQKGLWNGGNVPFGYAVANKKLLVDDKEADCLRFMFQVFAEDPSLSRLRGNYTAEVGTHGPASHGAKWPWTIFSEIQFIVASSDLASSALKMTMNL